MARQKMSANPMLKLTDSQKKAVESVRGNLLVSAGAGTGKTRVLVERFANLVKNQHALVTEILTLTFTEKAAAEMKSRILETFRSLKMESARRDLESAYISTIHSFASRILKEHPIEARVSPDFTVIEEDDADQLAQEILDEMILAGVLNQDGTYELLKIYGEEVIRRGILKILSAARVEGKSLTEYFLDCDAKRKIFSAQSDWHVGNEREIAGLFSQLNESELGEDWARFQKHTNRDIAWLNEFRGWMKPFSRRGGKKDKHLWKEVVARLKDVAGCVVEDLSQPWRSKIEPLCLLFEAKYEEKKREKGVLDFADLEIKALQLLTHPHPANRKILERYRKHFKYIMVDEFQDTNPLQSGLVEILSKGENLFYVGDFKQSIYSFRGTSPDFFSRKEKEYRAGGSSNFISLLENFRSSAQVIGFVNNFFQKIWAEDEFIFDELLVGKSGAGEAKLALPVELVSIPQGEEESLDHARFREAGAIVERILTLRQQGVPWGEMAILFQAMTSSGIYEYALKDAGIPFSAVSGRGFYAQPEIRDMLSFLRCLENPTADIYLAAVLRAPFFHISDETLLRLSVLAKAENEKNPLYHSLGTNQVAEDEFIEGAQKSRLKEFVELFKELLAQKDRLRIAELLELILKKTRYDLNALSSPDGTKAYANLKKLIDLAREHESRELITLGEFVRFIRGMETREIRESEAQLETEQSGKAVRLMTIHAAKGLEFPYVFLADLAREKVSMESKTILAQSSLGYSLVIPDDAGALTEKPIYWQRISETINQKERGEWKRLFYVAATRAKEKLILSGVWYPKKEPKENFRDMSSWMEWLMTVASDLPGMIVQEVKNEVGEKVHLPRIFPAQKSPLDEMLKNFSPVNLSEKITKGKISEYSNLLNDLKKQLRTWEAPKPRVIDLPVSAYALFRKDPAEWRRVYKIGYPGGYALQLAGVQTEIKPTELAAEDPWEEISPADFGTAAHAFLENLDLKNPGDNFEENLKKVFKGQGQETLVYASSMLSRFIKSDFFRQIQTSTRVLRELPFVINLRHGKIQGVMDLVFQDERGRWVILDYKTGAGDAQKAVKEGYDLQLAVYALAMRAILKVTPKSGVLYFMKNDHAEEITFSDKILDDWSAAILKLQEAMLEEF